MIILALYNDQIFYFACVAIITLQWFSCVLSPHMNILQFSKDRNLFLIFLTTLVLKIKRMAMRMDAGGRTVSPITPFYQALLGG